MNTNETAVLEQLVQWAERQPLVRAMLLTSTRAVPNAPVDILSDYDVILILTDIHPFHESRAWLAAFGQVLALFRDPIESADGALKSGYVVQFEEGLKIDFSLWEPGILRRIIARPQLDPELDAGYRILLDKDRLTDGLQPPTYAAFIPKPPTETEFRERIEMFLLDTIYFAKFLWRDDLMAAKYLLETFIKDEHLRPLLEWHIELAHGWSIKPGPYGRRMKKWLRPDLWADLEKTYTGAGVDENWAVLYNTIALMHKVAGEVAQQMGYPYPAEMERKTLAYLRKIQATSPNIS